MPVRDDSDIESLWSCATPATLIDSGGSGSDGDTSDRGEEADPRMTAFVCSELAPGPGIDADGTSQADGHWCAGDLVASIDPGPTNTGAACVQLGAVPASVIPDRLPGLSLRAYRATGALAWALHPAAFTLRALAHMSPFKALATGHHLGQRAAGAWCDKYTITAPTKSCSMGAAACGALALLLCEDMDTLLERASVHGPVRHVFLEEQSAKFASQALTAHGLYMTLARERGEHGRSVTWVHPGSKNAFARALHGLMPGALGVQARAGGWDIYVDEATRDAWTCRRHAHLVPAIRVHPTRHAREECAPPCTTLTGPDLCHAANVACTPALRGAGAGAGATGRAQNKLMVLTAFIKLVLLRGEARAPAFRFFLGLPASRRDDVADAVMNALSQAAGVWAQANTPTKRARRAASTS